MEIPRQSLARRLKKLAVRPSFWFIIVLFALITLPHYAEFLPYPTFLRQVQASLSLSRHSFDRILYLAPIIWSGFLFSSKGTVIASLASLGLMLPRALFISTDPVDATLETGAVFIMGNLLAITFNSLHKERARRAYLSALNQTSGVVSQSLDLSEVLKRSIDTVVDVMKADSALVYFLDAATGELTLAGHRGISDESAEVVKKLEPGEGFNGKVALTGEPLFIEDQSKEPGPTRIALEKDRIVSLLVVPLRSKDRVNGTLCIGMHSPRSFQREELELLAAIGNQIGVAIENARLYQNQQSLAEKLRASQKQYQQLFESAYDAIWLHDQNGHIIAANKATLALTGYSMDELQSISATDLFTESSLQSIKHVEQTVQEGKAAGSIVEANLKRKDGSEALVQLATSPVSVNGGPLAFQHIARDVSEQKQMEENLRFYLKQATRAQEDERKRISRELHDDTIQALVVLSRELDTLSFGNGGPSDKDRLKLEAIRHHIDGTLSGVRRLSQDLRPAVLDRLGLVSALEWLAGDVAKYSGIDVKAGIRGTERRLPEEVELVLFRIAQEALRNVWRHSAATKAEITAEFAERMTRIVISDNGRGFSPPKTLGSLPRDGKLGLAGMQERAQLLGASLIIRSEQGKGSVVTVELPG